MKKVKNDDDSAIKEQFLFCNRSFLFDYFSILTINNNGFKAILMRSFLNNRGHPSLNKNNPSFPLEVLDNQGTKFHHMNNRKIDTFGCSSFILNSIVLLHIF